MREGLVAKQVAEQTEPVRRRVALKVIKLGMDTKQVVARFEAERQALAMMDHPNIAKVLDAGSTEQGRPYFVMELVRGIRITDYCDQANLSTKDRRVLLIKVCQPGRRSSAERLRCPTPRRSHESKSRRSPVRLDARQAGGEATRISGCHVRRRRSVP